MTSFANHIIDPHLNHMQIDKWQCLITAAVNSYQQTRRPDDPQVLWRVKKKGQGETYFIEASGRTVHLEATSLRAAVYGWHQLLVTIPSGHYAEYLGEWTPRFALRPLWPAAEYSIEVIRGVTLQLPKELVGEGRRHFCERSLQLGYNSVILGMLPQENCGAAQDPSESTSLTVLSDVFSLLREYGLSIIIKPYFQIDSPRCILDPHYRSILSEKIKELIERLPQIEGIFWESEAWHSDCQHHPLAREKTQDDLVQTELRLLQEAIHEQCFIIFYLPCHDLKQAHQQALLLLQLCVDAHKKTILSFSSVEGDPWKDHLAPHPIWELLRQAPDPLNTPLLPLVNSGSIKQGEGLWPVLTGERIERFYRHCDRHAFAGIAHLLGTVPVTGSLAECNLFVASQGMWQRRSHCSYTETWFRGRRPDLNYLQHADALRRLSDVAVALSFVRGLHNECDRDLISREERRALVESTWGALNYLEALFGREPSSLYKDFVSFARDARRILVAFMRRFHITLPHIRYEDDGQEGVWTSAAAHRNGAHSVFLCF
jgi:hypothetical protein